MTARDRLASLGATLRAAPEAPLGVLLWAVMTLVVFEPAFRFHGDHERDLRFATLLVQRGLWPDATPAIAPTPFELGPMLYLLLAPIVAISPDPFWVRGAFVALGALAFWALHGLARRLVGRPAAGVMLLVALTCTFTFEAFAQLWHSTLLPLPIVGFWWALQSAEETVARQASPARPLLGAAACAAVAVQLHTAAVVHPILLALYAGLRWRALGGRRILAAMGLFALVLTPFLITLGQSIARGALSTAGGATRGWHPLGLGAVLDFVIHGNLHPLWGDVLGPALTWPVVVLLLLGVVPAARSTLGRLVLVNVALGLALESALLGNQLAHRYVHANAWALLLLVGWGAGVVASRVPRIVGGLGALVAAALTVEAAVSPVPRSASSGWLNASEQRAVAEVVVRRLPIAEDAMERQVHGIYFGEPMGMRHWHALLAPTPEARPEHLLVMPEDLAQVLAAAPGAFPAHGRPLGSRVVVRGNGRDVAIQAFAPWVGPLTLGGPDAEALASRWRRPGRPSGRVAVHTVATDVAQPGVVTLALADGRGRGCGVAATLDGRRLAGTPLDTHAYEWLRFVRWVVPRAGRLMFTLGPCPAPAFVDVF